MGEWAGRHWLRNRIGGFESDRNRRLIHGCRRQPVLSRRRTAAVTVIAASIAGTCEQVYADRCATSAMISGLLHSLKGNASGPK
jgi:hypothetical protein